MKSYRSLQVWSKSHELTLAIYRAAASFPREELYGLTSQVRRCAASIPSNIAEGCGRGSDAELRQFLQQAMGSATELDYQLLLARDLDLLAADAYSTLAAQVTEIQKMLAAFILRLRKPQSNGRATQAQTAN
jgi:four helix bundle protein